MDPNKKLQAVLLDRKTPATALVIIVADRLGFDAFQWDPETIMMEVAEAFGAELPPANFNKLMAGIELVNSDTFYRNLDDFIRLCNALYNGTVTAETFDPADAGEIAWGITEALMLWPPDPDDENPFDDKILGYIGKTVADEGIMSPPDVLRLGTGNADLWGQVQSQFSDDPIMFEAIHQKERDKTDEINAMVKARLTHALTVMQDLPLVNGQASDAFKKMLATIQQTKRESEELKPI